MNLGNNIKTLRKQVGLTQTELAEKLGVTEQTVSKWENDKCYPDVSLLPLLANVFNCSVDAVLGIDNDTYGTGLQKVLEKYSNCKNVNEEIELLLEALTKYPNSNELKHKLAHAYFMAWRIEDEKETRHELLNKVVNLCNNIITCYQNDAELDTANDLLIQIYAENGDYEKALIACNQLSVKSWKNRIVGIAQILKESNSCEFSKYAQNALFELQTTMRLICQLYYNNAIEEKKYDDALLFCQLQEKILSLFDTDMRVLYLCEKMMLSFQMASVYKKKELPDNIRECLFTMTSFAKSGILRGGEHTFSENPILAFVNEKEPYMTESETKRFVNTFLDKFADVISEEELQKFKI